ncbi:MAG: hypothetical protein IJ560_03260 [Alphaproteobacteria bacterium]|nr:hypothetical protein [Alphaproteobacteria bacterium]
MQEKIEQIESYVLDFIKKNPEFCKVGKILSFPSAFFTKYDKEEKNAAFVDMIENGWIEGEDLEHIVLTSKGQDKANE